MTRSLVRTPAVTVGLLGAVLVGCTPPPAAPPPPESPTVIVSTPIEVSLKPYAEFIARTVAVNDVEIVPEVTGIIKEVKFTEGGKVVAGDVLYLIDPVPFKAARDKADADVANYEAQRKNAEADLKRLEGIPNSTAKEKDETTARLRVAEAQIASAKAALVQAEFNLTKTKIITPIDGRITKTEKTAGNLVTTNQTKLTRIESIAPIYAYFDVDEATSLRYRTMIHKDKSIGDPRDPKTPLRCWMRLKNEDKWVREGWVDYISPDITRGTASREVRGVFDNADGFLTPGDSCRIRVEAGPKRPVLVVPEIAVGSQQSAKFVYVVGDDNKVLPRTVKLGEAREGMQAIIDGLKPTDRVVVNGLLRVRPGAVVTAVTEPIKLPAGFE